MNFKSCFINHLIYKELCINEEENHHYIINDATIYFKCSIIINEIIQLIIQG